MAAAERHGGPPPFDEHAICGRRDAVHVAMQQALQHRGYERPLVGGYAESGRGGMLHFQHGE
jgi:hypothetical protein